MSLMAQSQAQGHTLEEPPTPTLAEEELKGQIHNFPCCCGCLLGCFSDLKFCLTFEF